MRKIQRLAAVSAMAVLTAAVGACSSAQEPAPGAQAPGAQATSEAPPAPGAEAAPGAESGKTETSDVFGSACSQVPKEGEGSLEGMVDDPVATAAGYNPLLTNLGKAIGAANLADTLNSAEAITVFAPADTAFAKFESQNPGTLNQLTTASDVASPDSKLSKTLKYHVVGQRYDAKGIVQQSTLTSLEGSKLTIGGTPTAPTVNGASVLCGNIPTKNATVFIIDTVLTPPATESGR